MLTDAPAFKMHDVSAPDAGKREPCRVVKYRDLKSPKSTDL